MPSGSVSTLTSVHSSSTRAAPLTQSSSGQLRLKHKSSAPTSFPDQPNSSRLTSVERFPSQRTVPRALVSQSTAPTASSTRAAAVGRSPSGRSVRPTTATVHQPMAGVVFPSSEPPPPLASVSDSQRAMRSRVVSSPNSPSTSNSFGGRFSVSSSLTRTTYSPPRTPTYDDDSEKVSVIAPISGVETMDALVDSMNVDFFHPRGTDIYSHSHSHSNSSSSRRSKSDRKGSLPAWQDPLYQPPLPEPPAGVKLGGRLPTSATKSVQRSRSATTDAIGRTNHRRELELASSNSDDDETAALSSSTQRRPSEPFPSRIPVSSSLPPRRTSTSKISSPLDSRSTSSTRIPATPPKPSPAPSASSSRPPAGSSRPTPAQQIAAASRSKSSANASAHRRSSSKSKISSEFTSANGDTHLLQGEPKRLRDGSILTTTKPLSTRSRTTSNAAQAVDDPDSTRPHLSSASTSASGSRYTTASSSPSELPAPLPTLPRTASSASLSDRQTRQGTAAPKAEVVPSISDIIRAHRPDIAASQENARTRHAVRAGADANPKVPAKSPYMNGRPSVASQSSGSGFGVVIDGTGGHMQLHGADEFGFRPSTARSSNSFRDGPGRSHDFFSQSRRIPEDDTISTRTSIDSVALEAEQTLYYEYERLRASGKAQLPPTPVSVNTIVPFPSSGQALGSGSTKVVMPDSPASFETRHRRPSTSSRPEQFAKSPPNTSFPSPIPGSSPRVVGVSRDKSKDTALALASYLRSPRLTRLLTLTRKPHSSPQRGSPQLQVSLSDVGRETGRPVVVFLGLGGVRYMTALYDEMASALNLRLICIDRWGVGRTSEPPPGTSRGVVEWAGVVEEVLDQLDIGHVSVLAHSAGAPYAMAFAQRVSNRVHGEVCLLAPWVAEAAGYKWLKYVPNALVKTAQAAEWKMQGWKLGKPPTLEFDGIGYDATAEDSAATNEDPRRPSFGGSSFVSSEYDDLADFQGKFDGVVNGTDRPTTKRKPSKGFLRMLKGNSSASHSASNSPAPVQTQSMPQASTTGPTHRLKGLKSMGSLKGRYNSQSSQRARTISTATNATSATSATSPVLPHVPPVNAGLGLEWEALRASGGPATLPGYLDPPPGSGHSRPGSEKSQNPPLSSDRSSPTDADKERNLELSMASALLSASHAESAKGLNADLLVMLNHDRKPWGFSYQTFSHPVQVWHGDRDEKIGEPAVRWMEKVMKRCQVTIVKGAGHNLMTNPKVVVEAMDWICDAWDRD